MVSARLGPVSVKNMVTFISYVKLVSIFLIILFKTLEIVYLICVLI